MNAQPWIAFLTALSLYCTPITDENGDGHKVLACLGDSNTCLGTPGDCNGVRSWCSFLEDWLTDEVVVNLSWGGARGCEGSLAADLPQQYATSQAMSPAADVVVWSFGTNDYPHSDPVTAAACQEAVLEQARADGVRVLIATVPPVPDDPVRSDHAAALSAELEALEVPIADFATGFEDPDLFIDAVHLGDAAQLRRARIVALALLR